MDELLPGAVENVIYTIATDKPGLINEEEKLS